MKPINNLTKTAFISALVLAGCAKDVYDPTAVPVTPPKANPLSIQAPSSFDWSTLHSVKVNVQVKDEFDGQYAYLVEVFTSNPAIDAEATPIAAGVAKKGTNFVSEVTIPVTADKLYFRQTDPKGRKETYEYSDVSKTNSITAKLYYTATQTKSAMTRAVGSTTFASDAAAASGAVEPAAPNYPEEVPTVPSNLTPKNQWGGMWAEDGQAFHIAAGETYKHTINAGENKRIKIYVEGTWELGDWSSIQGAEIYIMNGGKLQANGTLTLDLRTKITIQSGGVLNCKGTLTSGAAGLSIKNYGTITANAISFNGNDQEFYNSEKGEVTVKGTAGFTGNNGLFYNLNKFTANSFSYISSHTAVARLLNTKNATLAIKKELTLGGSHVFNYGTITMDKNQEYKSGVLMTNNTAQTKLINHHGATFEANHVQGGLGLYNDGFVEVWKLENSGSSDELYNSCTVIVKSIFDFRKVDMSKGSISGGRSAEDSDNWLPVPNVRGLNNATFTMRNGSMIKATVFNGGNPSYFIGAGDDLSILAAETFNYGGDTWVSGSIVWGVNKHGNVNGWNRHIENSVVQTGFDESKYTIETCGGFFNPGNNGGDPKDPTFPIVVEDVETYTYLFEDNWPAYGDFDLNDLVISISNKGTAAYASGYLKSAKLDIKLEALGARKMLGLGIRFLGLPAEVAPSKFTVKGADASFEGGQKKPTYILFEDAHSQFGLLERAFVNTLLNDKNNQQDVPNYSIRFEFNESDKVPASAFNTANLDLFIINRAESPRLKRLEVHLPGYAPTEVATALEFGQGNDNSSVEENRYYLSNENLAWAVVIPGKFAWAKEYQKVTDVYAKFAAWIQSGGQAEKDWYNTYEESLIFKK